MNMNIDRVPTEEEKIDRGQQAAHLLAHPLLQEALDGLVDQCLKDFADAQPGDVDRLNGARMMLETAGRFQQIFKGLIRQGKNAADNAEFEPPEIS